MRLPENSTRSVCDGSGLGQIGRFPVSGIRLGAADHISAGYRVIDRHRLQIRQRASFAAHETAFGEKPVCVISVRERYGATRGA